MKQHGELYYFQCNYLNTNELLQNYTWCNSLGLIEKKLQKKKHQKPKLIQLHKK